jgi:hypothetical protein
VEFATSFPHYVERWHDLFLLAGTAAATRTAWDLLVLVGKHRLERAGKGLK